MGRNMAWLFFLITLAVILLVLIKKPKAKRTAEPDNCSLLPPQKFIPFCLDVNISEGVAINTARYIAQKLDKNKEHLKITIPPDVKLEIENRLGDLADIIEREKDLYDKGKAITVAQRNNMTLVWVLKDRGSSDRERCLIYYIAGISPLDNRYLQGHFISNV